MTSKKGALPKDYVIYDVMTTNWYKTALAAQDMHREAGLLENTSKAIIGLALLMMGHSLFDASRQSGVSEEEIRSALQDPVQVEQAQEYVQQNQPVQQEQEIQQEQPASVTLPQINEIVRSIIRHEGLLPYQTPARITNPTMRSWKTYQGFPVWQNPPENVRPANRRNFIFLQNQEDVPKAIAKQLQNYANNPSRFGLPSNPTLEDAVRMFDHENPDAKMRLMKSEMPNIDFKQPLAKYIN